MSQTHLAGIAFIILGTGAVRRFGRNDDWPATTRDDGAQSVPTTI